MLKKIFFIMVLLSLSSYSYVKETKWMIEDTIKVSGEYVKSVTRIYSQTLVYSHPKSWPLNPIYRKQTKNHFIVEYIPKNQTLKNWKDMFTIQGFENLVSQGITSIKMLDFIKQKLYSIAPDKFYYDEIFRGDINGVSGVIVLMGIKELPKTLIPELPKGVGEIGLYLVLQGKKDIYIIHRAWKGEAYSDKELPMSENELNKWIKLLKKISLV